VSAGSSVLQERVIELVVMLELTRLEMIGEVVSIVGGVTGGITTGGGVGVPPEVYS